MIVFRNGALPGGQVTAQLVLASGTTGARSTLATLTATVDSTGHWQLDLSPNATVKPAGTFWDITEPTSTGDPNFYQITVPTPASNTSVNGVQVTSCPAAAGSGAGVKPTITGSRGTQTAAVLGSLLTALAAQGTIINNTTA